MSGDNEEKKQKNRFHVGFMASKAQRDTIDRFAAFHSDKIGIPMTRSQAFHYLLKAGLKSAGFDPETYR
tara:strand:+ start:247 stop:453 length:207 start_codon:yes stop_codon:yes gene_type:complete